MARTITKIGNLRPTVNPATNKDFGTVKQIAFGNVIGRAEELTPLADGATVDAAAYNTLLTAFNQLLSEHNRLIGGMEAAGMCTRPAAN